MEPGTIDRHRITQNGLLKQFVFQQIEKPAQQIKQELQRQGRGTLTSYW